MPTKLSVFCEKVIEAGWLLALIIVPLFFNPYSQRVFEPDKISLLRSIALIIVGAWIIRHVELSHLRPELEIIEDQRPNLWKRFFGFPLMWPIFLMTAVYLSSTLSSVAPRISLWGSYTRLQGLFSTFSYMVFFFSILYFLRKQDQLNRLWNILILTSLPIAFYGLLQYTRLDPMPWAGERAQSVASRVVSTMGNPIFLGAYLVFVIPMTLAKITEFCSRSRDGWGNKLPRFLLAAFFSIILGLQLFALLFTRSRGPWLGLMAGIFVFILFSLLSFRKRGEVQGPLQLRDGVRALAFAIISLPIGVLPSYLFLVLTKRGRRWLWLSWFFQALVIMIILILTNIRNTPLPFLRQIPSWGRLAQLAYTETGSVMVRIGRLVEAPQQFMGELGTLLLRKDQCCIEEFIGAHADQFKTTM